MIKISKQNNSLIVEGIDNVFYPNNGDNSYPLNSLIVVTDNSDMATFRSVATNDVLFSGLINNITINGEAVTKDNIIAKFDAVSNSSTGGGGTVDAYTKEEADNKFASKDELTAVEAVADDAVTKVDALTPRVEGVETAMNDKQDLLVSGTNIKTINSQSILGSGDLAISGVSEEQAQEIAKIPTIESELAQKANTSDVPTVQNGRNGTNKNYVYSNADSSKDNDKVVSDCIFINNAIDRLDFFVTYWGDGGPSKFTDVPLATPETAGIMSGNDKTKLDSIPENIAANVSALETAMNGKQDTLVSGTNIKTVNSQSILGEGNIEVSGGAKIYDASEIPENFKDALYQAVYEAYYTVDKTVYIDKSTDIEEFLSNLKTGDYLQLDESVLIQCYGFINNYAYKFAIKTGKETTDIHQYGRLITVQILSDSFAIKNNNSGPVLQKNDLKTINGEEIVGSGNIEVSGGISDEQAQEIAKIPTLETSLNNKQDTLVSGTNIKTINGNSILGEGNLVIEGGGIDLSNYYNKTEVDTKLDTKQNTLVSGTNIKTINSQSILGEGNIEVTIPDATTATSGAMSAADKTKLDSISTEWTGTQSEYDALTTKEDNIIYYVTE